MTFNFNWKGLQHVRDANLIVHSAFKAILYDVVPANIFVVLRDIVDVLIFVSIFGVHFANEDVGTDVAKNVANAFNDIGTTGRTTMNATADDDGPTYSVDTTCFDDLVGEQFVVHVIKHADERVMYRLTRAADHYNKALKLFGVDDEMAAMRLIAAEEELVVAIIRHVKIKEAVFPDTGPILRRFDDHRVKQAFAPTLGRFWHAMEHQFRDGFSVGDLEHVRWTYTPILEGGKFKLSLRDEGGKHLIGMDPLSIKIDGVGLDGKGVVEALFADFEEWTQKSQGLSVSEFILRRAGYRNQLLYAYDDYPITLMAESIDELHEMFRKIFTGLLYVLSAIVNNDPPSREWGVVCQFFALYRHVLATMDIGKAPEANEVEIPDDFFVLNVKAASPSA